MATHQPPPLTGIRVLEFAGLAPGPFAGLLLADYGASVLRLDRTSSAAPATDQLTRRKTSICVDIKSASGLSLIKNLIPHVDVIIDPFRPGVLEKAGLCPETVLLKLNPRLIVARITGFRREGKYADMAGHDINYLAVNGVLSMLGRKGEKPFPPGNILADFAGGGAICFMGILLALLSRQISGRGQVVEANMVDGSAMLSTFLRLALKTPRWSGERGTNLLDGGAPFYDTYETKDGKYMAVGAIEPQFYAVLIKGLNFKGKDIPDQWDTAQWPALYNIFTETFKSKTRAEWEAIFDGTDACCTPVLTHGELEKQSYDQRPAVTLKSSPGLAVHEGETGRQAAVGQGKGCEGSGWDAKLMAPGHGGKETLSEWLGWKEGRHFIEQKGGLVWKDGAKL